MLEVINQMIETSGFANLTWQHLVMIALALVFLYLGIKKEYEPYLMVPIAFGILLVNLPLGGLMAHPENGNPGGLLYYLYQGTNLGIYPPLIFLCLGASTDFGPLIANPKTILLGGAAQLGIFAAFFLAIVLGMTPQEAASVGIIGGADGPTAIYVTTRLAPDLLATIALAAYSYMALVPIIQPPIIRALTTQEERKTKMVQARPVSQTEKIIFPIVVTIFVSLMVPSATTLVGCLMLGNLVREIKIVPKITENLQNTLMYCITIILGLTVGAKANAELFLSLTTLKIIALGLLAFSIGTAGGVLLGKVMYRLSGKKINPMIGAAGVSAVPMAARVVQKVGQEEDPSNFLLMHAMGPNVAGVIGSAIAAGALLAFFG
ncbi:sodium ion-translocating decarboxylase subunit beta [Streptococcus porci]|uniref:sodium ion-translocating decarboxylase subunit beta n=1 Tax=Streptococcus porci TaxID=502567 RepID=UPI0003FD474B|nr:sodium ion-translocating decarboxylase subunit beta [Streptococcus porci]